MSCKDEHDKGTVQEAEKTAEKPALTPPANRTWALRHGQKRGKEMAAVQTADLKKMGIEVVKSDHWMQKASGRRGRPDLVGYMGGEFGLIIENKTDRLDNLTPAQLKARIEKMA